jgi:RecA/RadA recombinase
VLLSEIEPVAVDWLWEGWIPRGKITTIEGDPGTGKSTLTLDLAARVSTGRALPGGEETKPEGVVVWGCEDDLRDTVVPRLIAAGADLSRIVAREYVRGTGSWEEEPPLLDNIEALLADIERVDAALVIVDPLVAFLPPGTNTHNDHAVRHALGPVTLLARGRHVAVTLIRHLNKGIKGNPTYGGGGSIGFTAAARSALLVANDPDDPLGEKRVVAWAKGNLARRQNSLGFRIVEEGGGTRIEWTGESRHTAESLLAANGRANLFEASPAEKFLAETLQDGPRPVKDIVEAGRMANLSVKQLQTAADHLPIKKAREGFGPGSRVVWSLLDGT